MGACLKADTYRPDAPRSNCGSWLACDDGLPADTYRPDAPRSTCGSGLAREGGLAGDPVIPSTYPFLRLRPLRVPPDGGSLSKSAKVTKALLPLHSAPRLGSVCPNTGLNPWAAATRHPWRGAANPASCRVAHEFKPAFGQRGLTGRLRSRADQERLASHREYVWRRRSPLLLQQQQIHKSLRYQTLASQRFNPPFCPATPTLRAFAYPWHACCLIPCTSLVRGTVR